MLSTVEIIFVLVKMNKKKIEDGVVTDLLNATEIFITLLAVYVGRKRSTEIQFSNSIPSL